MTLEPKETIIITKKEYDNLVKAKEILILILEKSIEKDRKKWMRDLITKNISGLILTS